MQRSALPRRRRAPPSRETSPKPSPSWSAATTMPRHPAAAPIGWLSSLTPLPVQPAQETEDASEKRAIRAPQRSGGGRGQRHTRGGLAGDRLGTGHLVLVRTDQA